MHHASGPSLLRTRDQYAKCLIMQTACAEPDADADADADADSDSAPLPPLLSGSSRVVNSGGGLVSDQHHHLQSLPTLDCATRHSTHQQQAAPSNSPGHYATDLCDSPVASSASDESMNTHGDHTTPPESLVQAGFANTGAATEQIGRLSLDYGAVKGESPLSYRGRGMLNAVPAVASKRSASSELSRPGGHQAARCSESQRTCHAPPSSKTAVSSQRRGLVVEDDHRESAAKLVFDSKQEKPRQPLRDDSGYASQHSLPYPNACESAPPRVASQSTLPKKSLVVQLHAHSRYPGLTMQPHSSPISKEQLAAEVKGIYAGLVMVEAKCTSIDTAQAENLKSTLEPEQWQALIALHRTLLYEHHDFLMATQHPSATPALRCLPARYNMPARMWKHGIHGFLELLRHRRPHSQQYMLAFIYLAYQMMALLFETVPSFTDTWIECLGDLARYRMAIEEEKEAHATWGGVAARWYTMASDRHPAIGRLYHHLGILERPSLRKFCFYAKSLTCVIPFQNARDSLSTLCTPIVQDERTAQSSSQSAEARIVTYHALLYAKADRCLIESVGADALKLIQQQPSRLREFGAFLAVTNIAALFNLGDTTNFLWQNFMAAISLSVQTKRSSSSTGPCTAPQVTTSPPSHSLASSMRFWSSTFALIVRLPLRDNEDGCCSLGDCLPYVNVMLVWLHSLLALQNRLSDNLESPVALAIDFGVLAWDSLASFLNLLAAQEGVSARTLEYARLGVFTAPHPDQPRNEAKPLTEDYIIRGLVWGQFYFCPGWFEGQGEDDGRGIETAEKLKSRNERVLWLGLYLAFHTPHLGYDESTKRFFATCENTVPAACNRPALVYAAADVEQLSRVSKSDPASSSNSDDGFAIVKRPKVTDAQKTVVNADLQEK